MPGSIVVDFAWTKPTVAQLQSWGAVAVGGYVSHDASKSLSAANVRAFAAAGIKSFAFFEDGGGRALGGYAAGAADAKFAAGAAAAIGMPSWAPVIAAVDFDVADYAPSSADPMAKLGPVGQYLKGWCDTIGKDRTGVYGGYWAVTRAIAAGVASCAVQTIAWSGGQVDLKDIACLQSAQMLDGGQVDIEVITDAQKLNFIAWKPGEPDPRAPVPARKPAPAPAGVSWSQWPSSVTLRYGSNSQAVRVLQQACHNSGIYGVRGITVDGDFGPQTLTAVKNFQTVSRLAVDGIAGKNTRAALAALKDV